MEKKFIVLVDREKIKLLDSIFSGMYPQNIVVQMFLVGELENDEENKYDILPLKFLKDTENFDAVLVLSNQREQLKKLVETIFFDIKNNIDFYFEERIIEILDDRGKMEFFKTQIELKYKRLSPPHAIGDFSYYTNLSIFCENISEKKKCIIGKFSSIGPDNVFLLGEEHHIEWLSSYPLSYHLNSFGPQKNITTFSKGNIVIGNDVWTGHGVTILSGVEIGDGSVIGAGAVVAKSVEPYSIVVGNPGRVIKKRFSNDVIEKLLEMKWWDWDYEHIYRVRNILESNDIDALYEYWLEHVL